MKITNLFLTVIIAITISCTTPAPNKSVSIIPKPQNLELLSGNFVLSKNTKIVISEGKDVKKVAEYFINKMNSVSKLDLEIQEGNAENCPKCISLSLSDEITNPEGYKLLVSEDGVQVEAKTANGLFYGMQTILQLLPPEVEGSKKISGNLLIPSVKIEDEPRFAWRGMHLDEARHFQGKELVKKYIDMLAMHKLNVFHWHLTDEQGWRIEIKKYPKLTEIGAWRVDRDYEPWGLSDEQRKPFEPGEPLHGGFYTQDEIREIVKYAEDRFITIVPEIEMPGHSQAALVCYPEFSCFGRANHIPVGMYTAEDWNFSDPYCVGNEKTFEFLQDVLTEVMALFPSEYIHIGGDECRKARWEECPKCQKRMKDEGMKEVEELQSYMIKRIEKFLNSKGRKLVGWQEILEGGLSPNATVMAWKGSTATEACLESAHQGHDVIMSTSSYLYFNVNGNKQAKVYSFEPIPKDLPEDKHKYIIGVNACAWGEHTLTPKYAERQLTPNLSAMAEVAWTYPEQKNYEDFTKRMDAMYQRMIVKDVNYFIQPLKEFKEKVVFSDKVVVDLISPDSALKLRYTTDGTEPTENSRLYSKPFSLEESTTLTVTAFDKFGQSSESKKIVYEKQTLLKPVELSNPKSGLIWEFSNKRYRSAAELKDMKSDETGVTESIKAVKENGEKDGGQILKGYINVPEDGIYTFYVASGDGSLLYVGNRLVVDNDGYTSAYDKYKNIILKEGQVVLAKGYHPLKIYFFDWGKGEEIRVFIKGPGLEKQEISAEMLFHK